MPHNSCLLYTSIPGFAEARADIEKYVGGKKGYKKNKSKYDERTVQLVQDNCCLLYTSFTLFFSAPD